MSRYRYKSGHIIVVVVDIVIVIVPVLSVSSWPACTPHQISRAEWPSLTDVGAA